MSTSNRRVALWLRVSTHEQTVENQRIQLHQLAEHRGYEVVREYDLSGISAWQNKQQAWVSQVIVEAPQFRFNTLLIAGLDRLSRGGIQATLHVLHRLTAANIAVVSLREPEVDTTTPFGELLIAFFATCARIESQHISERTKAGIERARAQGKQIGRPKGSKNKMRRRRSS